jgi:hypothetical protein
LEFVLEALAAQEEERKEFQASVVSRYKILLTKRNFSFGVCQDDDEAMFVCGKNFYHYVQVATGKQWANNDIVPGLWIHVRLKPTHPPALVKFVGVLVDAQNVVFIGLKDGVDGLSFQAPQVRLHTN